MISQCAYIRAIEFRYPFTTSRITVLFRIILAVRIRNMYVHSTYCSSLYHVTDRSIQPEKSRETPRDQMTKEHGRHTKQKK